MDGVSSPVIFWTKDESDADLNHVAQRGAHVPGVTDTAMDLKKKSDVSRRQDISQSKQRKEHKTGQAGTQGRERLREKTSKQAERISPSKEGPSLKDLRVEDKKRVANLIKELAKTGEEKEVALQQLDVERKERDLEAKQLQRHLAAIMKERENIQQQYLECQKLLSSYQTKVSEDQEQLSLSLHDSRSRSPVEDRKGTNRWSPLKESGRAIPSSDSHEKFVQLQPVRDDSNQDEKRTQSPSNVSRQIRDDSSHLRQKHSSASRASTDQFNPVLSSTHRSHQSRVPAMHGLPGQKGAEMQGMTNGLAARKQERMYELSPTVANLKQNKDNGKFKPVSREGSSGRISSDRFLPLQEVTDYTRSTSGQDNPSSSQKSSEGKPQSNAWASLPEMTGNLPSSAESRLKESSGISDPQYTTHEGYVLNKNGKMHQDLGEQRGETLQGRREDFGFMRDRLQQEQQWLQHRLQEQERLLKEKQIEVQLQKLHLSQQMQQTDVTSKENQRYEKVRRSYLQQDRRETYRRDGAAALNSREAPISQEFHRPNRMIDRDGLSWEQHPDMNGEWNGVEPVSTKFPPDGMEQYRQRTFGQPMSKMQDQGYRDQVPNQQEEEYLDIVDDGDDYDDEEEEVENDDAWYEMREVTEGADSHDIIQGYASLHPADTRRQGGIPRNLNHGASQGNQSYLVSDVATPSHAADTRARNGNHHSERPMVTQQLGSITAILEAEDLDHPPDGRAYDNIGLRGQQTTSYAPHPQARSDMLHGNVPGAAGGLPLSRDADFVPHSRVSWNSHQGVRDGTTDPRTAGNGLHSKRTGVTMAPNPRVAGSMVSHPRVAGRTSQTSSTNGTLLHQGDHSYQHPHHNGALPFPNGGHQIGGFNSRGGGQRAPMSGVGQAPHQRDKVITGGYRIHEPGHGHGRQTEGAAHQAGPSSKLIERSSQVIRDIGLLLKEDEEVGDEEESRVLEDVFFLK